VLNATLIFMDNKQSRLPTRTLVSEVLITQLVFAAVVGLIAVTCVWWIANRVVRDNLDDWSLRWVGELEALGSGLYLEDGDERFLNLENYLLRFPEILYVRFYDEQGNIIYVEKSEQKSPFKTLQVTQVADLKKRIETDESHVVDESLSPYVRISKAITTESVLVSDLFSINSFEDMTTKSDIAGYIELGLDYSKYDRSLVENVMAGSAFIFAAFGLLMGFGWLILRRAVKPLSVMEKPLLKLAEGNFDIEVPASSHREIAAIGNALQTAARNIQERDQHLRKLASFDSLTGMANRHHFLQQFSKKLNQSGGAILFIDLDQFKTVNDTYGHAAGDEILTQCAERIRQTVRPQDLIARLGGDEFVMFVPRITGTQAKRIANQLLSDLGKYPLSYGGKSFTIGCSVGVSIAKENTIYTTAELLSQADLACRHAKNEGRNCVHLYKENAGERETIKGHVEWRQRIQDALKNNRFELHYQAIMHAKSGSIKHYEALIRLRENKKLYFPDSFLPAAERSGLTKDIDRWVIETAMRELAEHHKLQPDLQFSINITGNTFMDGNFTKFVRSQLKRFKLSPSSVIFEITEQVAIGSLSDAIPQIEQLVELGCEFAVDDFGTGYSSLNYIKRLPVQYVKIDGAFINGLCESTIDQTIVQAIADIAHIVGMKTIAEFVGDEATLKMVTEIGIDYVQGYHIGKPARTLLATTPEQNVVPLAKKNVRKK